MKRIILLLSIFVLLFVSCDNNVYIDENIDKPRKNIWRVGSEYFETANDAINYIKKNSRSRGITKTDDESRTIVLTRPVLAENSDGIENDTYNKYVEDKGLRGNITVPEDFTGSLTIDFGGCRYDFYSGEDAFFVINGGDNVYIYNGTSVIFEDANIEPYAISVDTDTVTIDEHMIDDRRTSPKAVEIKSNGTVVITAETEREKTDIEGDFSIGGSLSIEDGVINITKVETESGYSFSITGGKITNPHEYDGIIKPAINEEEFEKNGGEHTPEHVLETVEAKAPTCTEPGWDKYEYCKYCNYTTKVEIPALGHSLETHEKRNEATCTENGNVEYWQCSRCSKYFSDENAENEIETIVINALGHDDTGTWVTDSEYHWRICARTGCDEILDKESHKYTTWTYSDKDNLWHSTCDTCSRPETDTHREHRLEHHPYTKPTCTENGNYEYWQCSICKKYYSDKNAEKEITDIESIIISAEGHSPEHVPENEATCTKSGNIEYWYCSECGKCFKDKDAVTEIKKEDTVTSASGHSLKHTDSKKATCTESGNIEYWYCSKCGKYFEDKNAVTEINEKDTVIPATGHEFDEHEERKEATCTEDGNVEYWHCKNCGKYFGSDDGKTEIAEESLIIPHHTLSEWQYDDDSHWKTCKEDKTVVLFGSHEWGEWQEHPSWSVKHLYSECSVCGARKVATKPEYDTYGIDIAEIKFKNIEDTPCGDFYINNVKVESGEKISVSTSDIKAEFRPYIKSNTNYKAYSYLDSNELSSGGKDESGRYEVTFSIAGRKEHTLNIQINTGGGSLGFDCYIKLE